MKTKKTIALVLAAVLALGALAGCGASGDKKAGSEKSSAPAQSESKDKTIVVGASPAPHAEILKALQPEFEKEGYKLEVKEFTDYVLPNKALADGEIDANYFQHKPFLDNFNGENKTNLVPVAYVHYEPMALFPGKTETLDGLKNGAKIAVPNDTSNEARALLLLEENGLIKLKQGTGIKATVRDIQENPKNIEIVEMEAAQIPRALQDVDMAVINGNFAIASNIPFDKHIAAEGKDSLAARVYANLVAMRVDDKDSDKAKVLHKVLTGDAAVKFINDNYKGTVLPADQKNIDNKMDTGRTAAAKKESSEKKAA